MNLKDLFGGLLVASGNFISHIACLTFSLALWSQYRKEETQSLNTLGLLSQFYWMHLTSIVIFLITFPLVKAFKWKILAFFLMLCQAIYYQAVIIYTLVHLFTEQINFRVVNSKYEFWLFFEVLMFFSNLISISFFLALYSFFEIKPKDENPNQINQPINDIEVVGDQRQQNIDQNEESSSDESNHIAYDEFKDQDFITMFKDTTEVPAVFGINLIATIVTLSIEDGICGDQLTFYSLYGYMVACALGYIHGFVQIIPKCEKYCDYAIALIFPSSLIWVTVEFIVEVNREDSCYGVQGFIVSFLLTFFLAFMVAVIIIKLILDPLIEKCRARHELDLLPDFQQHYVNRMFKFRDDYYALAFVSFLYSDEDTRNKIQNYNRDTVYHLPIEEIANSFKNCLIIAFIQIMLVISMFYYFLGQQKDQQDYDLTFSLIITRLLSSIILHLQIEGEIYQGLFMMKYTIYECKSSRNRLCQFIIALLQISGGLSAEILNQLLICTLDNEFDIVVNLIAFGVIAEIDDWYAESQRNNFVRDIVSEGEFEVKDRPVLSEGYNKNFLALLQYGLYKVLQAAYDGFYYYFFPFMVILLTMLN